MSRLRDLVRDFGVQLKVKTSDWSVAETAASLLVSNISDIAEACRLHQFLTARDLVVTIVRGGKRGTASTVMARLPLKTDTKDTAV